MRSQEVLKQAKKLAKKDKFSRVFTINNKSRDDQERSKDYSQTAKKQDALNEARGQNSPTSSSGSQGLISGMHLRLKIMYTNTDGLMVSSLELKFKN